MFLNECTACGREQLIFLSQVSAYEETSRGVVAHFTCWCGAPQTWLASPAADSRSSLPDPRCFCWPYFSRERASRSCGSTVPVSSSTSSVSIPSPSWHSACR